MAFGGTRGLMQRWEPVLGAVALFLMLLSAAAAQEPSGAGEGPGAVERARGPGWAGRGGEGDRGVLGGTGTEGR